MARTKNRGYQQALAPACTTRRWKMGGYIRLSREDLQKINRGLDDSNSVKNQRDIRDDFHHNHIDEFESYTEYVDDGHTGTDTERESFQRLLGDVMSGKINCVVVKDLSRFARNYSDAGSLIDNLFVQMGVRFISLAEGVDSYLNPDSVNSIIVPISNVMNDQYCYQTSKKIRQVFDYKRRNGQSYRLDDLISGKEKELAKITRYKQSLYQDWKDGEISQLEYREMKADYERQAAGFSNVLARLTAERAELSSGVDQQHPALAAFAKYQNIEKLTREILIELVDHIKVYENGNISVKFKFADEFRKIAEYIEINTTDTAEAGCPPPKHHSF